MYTEEVMDHFKNPRNYGKIENPNGVGKVGNIVCGDVMWLYIRVGEKEKIEDISFETFGCAAAIATSSKVTEIAKGKKIIDVLKINKNDVVKGLKDLPPIKIHCSVLAVDALDEAIYDYLEKNGKKISESLKERHEKIKKDKEIIEKRYKDWIKTEERESF